MSTTSMDKGVTTVAPSRRTVDAPTRVFHWLLALCFVGAYVTSEGERWRLVHVTLGYTMAGLLSWRVLWGLLGPRHARLGALWRKTQGVRNVLLSLRGGQALNGRQLQTVLMAVGVLALMSVIALTTASGYVVYQDWWGEAFEEVHEVMGNTLLSLVLAHVALVVGISVWRRQNQVTPMITGRTAGAGQDVVRHNQGWLAALMVVCVLAFWGWQWQSAPTAGGTGSGPAASQGHGGHHGHDHDDDDDED